MQLQSIKGYTGRNNKARADSSSIIQYCFISALRFICVNKALKSIDYIFISTSYKKALKRHISNKTKHFIKGAGN